MTEGEWLECTDSMSMLRFLRFKFGVRKLRLFTVACYRRKWHRLDDQTRKAVEFAEQLAYDREGVVARGLRAAKMDADAAAHAAMCAMSSAQPGCAAQTALLREVFGNPFRPVAVDPYWLAWNDGTVVRLAQVVYEERAFDRLPILADALEEAGCDNTDILSHCRQPGEHVRGCWALDLLLGKQ
jgi:hypothetical protein